MKRAILTALVTSGAVLAAAHAPTVNSGDFPVEKVPQFICIGSDDNFYPEGFDWIYSYLKKVKNPSQKSAQPKTFDGTPALMSFYVNTNNGGNLLSNKPSKLALVALYKEALMAGHEIGNHTRTHGTSSGSSLDKWNREIAGAITDLQTIGISHDSIVGFRTPFLAYGDNTFKAVSAAKYLYDCSISTGFESKYDGTNFIWPYLLDNGVDSLDALHQPTYDSTDAATNTKIKVPVQVGAYPGLWEIPVYKMIVPPSFRKAVYEQRIQNFPETTLGDKVIPAHSYTSEFDTLSGKIEGMDYNMWSMPSTYGGLGLDSLQFLETLKYSLDQRLLGNRAPMTVVMHSNIFYDDHGYRDESNKEWNGPDATAPRASVAQMRGAIEAFIQYALTKPEVRFVTQRDLVKWCKDPVAFKTPISSVQASAKKEQRRDAK